jgi:hypothetical protein
LPSFVKLAIAPDDQLQIGTRDQAARPGTPIILVSGHTPVA